MTIIHNDQFDLGQVVYNGFKFPPALNSSVQCSPVYDDTERSIMYMMYKIRIEFIVDLDHVGTLGEAAGEAVAKATGGSKGSIDNQIAHLRRKLCQVGRPLHVANIGLGPDLYVNDPAINYVWDVTWGPKPRMISWKPLGMNRACSIVWECEVGLVECENPAASNKERYQPEVNKPYKRPLALGNLPWNVLQLYYNQTWDIDDVGATTKTYDAVIETRGQINPADVRLVMDCADNYRIFFEPPLQAGFKRTRNYRLTPNKTRLEVTITDSEVDSDWPYPPGVVDINVDYNISSSLMGKSAFGKASAWNIWEASLSGSFTLAKGFHPFWRRIYPYYLVLLLIRSRYTPEGANPGKEPTTIEITPNSSAKTDPPEIAIPMDFSLSESVFGRTFTFQFNFIKFTPPEDAVYKLAFGNPPNQYVEVSTNSGSQFAHVLRNAGDNWDWNLWLSTVYGSGNDTTNNDFLRNPITLRLHALKGENRTHSASLEVQSYSYTFPVLGRWDNGVAHQPFGGAYSNRGFRGLWFEGDARQEPCMENPDFWYTRVAGGSSATGNIPDANIYDAKVPNKMRVIAYTNQYEILDVSPAKKLTRVNAGHVNLSMAIANGEPGYTPEMLSGGGATNSYISTLSAEPAASNPNPDRDLGWTGTDANLDYTSNHVNYMQAGMSDHIVRMFGYAIAYNKPCPVPRQLRFGKAALIKGKSRTKVEHLVDRGKTQIYKTMWDLQYYCVGDPQAGAEELRLGLPAPYGNQGTGSPAAGVIKGN